MTQNWGHPFRISDWVTSVIRKSIIRQKIELWFNTNIRSISTSIEKLYNVLQPYCSSFEDTKTPITIHYSPPYLKIAKDVKILIYPARRKKYVRIKIILPILEDLKKVVQDLEKAFRLAKESKEIYFTIAETNPREGLILLSSIVDSFKFDFLNNLKLNILKIYGKETYRNFEPFLKIKVEKDFEQAYKNFFFITSYLQNNQYVLYLYHIFKDLDKARLMTYYFFLNELDINLSEDELKEKGEIYGEFFKKLLEIFFSDINKFLDNIETLNISFKNTKDVYEIIKLVD